MVNYEIIQGDCIQTMKGLPAGSVQTCVTSPPYYGLRDYGTAQWEGGGAECDHVADATKTKKFGNPEFNENRPSREATKGDGYYFKDTCGKCGARRIDNQIGLEETPEAYVAKLVDVFREVRRLLRDDGTLWLNLGDSYFSPTKGDNRTPEQLWRTSSLTTSGGKMPKMENPASYNSAMRGKVRLSGDGLKPKDLIGIPWMVAFALRQPYYTGSIKKETDRIWLAAMIDAEGCFFVHRRLANSEKYRRNDTYGAGIEIANTSLRIIERCQEIVGGRGSISTSERGNGRNQTLYRLRFMSAEARDIAREVYPYIVGKRQQCRIICAGQSSGPLAQASWEAVKILNQYGTTDVDFPEPAPMVEPGYYLRSDVIWSKPNPMPESVTDRPTKAHEYIFLLSKSSSYYYDADAIREPHETMLKYPTWNLGNGDSRPPEGKTARNYQGAMQRTAKNNNAAAEWNPNGRNKRSVWTVTTKPYAEAHFATFPPDLIEPCILAGSKVGDTILDPFAGAGTTLLVAVRHGRKAIGCELNPDYVALASDRIYQDNPLLQGTPFAYGTTGIDRPSYQQSSLLPESQTRERV